MAHKWNEMSVAEKCDVLRANAQETLGKVSELAGEFVSLQRHQEQMRLTLSEVVAAVEKLEREMRDGR